MDNSSSPPVLYLGDDDDDNDDDSEQNHYFESNMSLPKASSSNEMNLPRKKRKLTNTNVCVNPSVVNWSKRQRNDHYQQRLSQNLIESDLDSEPILLDPDEYIIEEPDSQSYRSFDWTIQSPPSLPPPLISTKISSNPIQTTSRVSNVTTSNVNNITKRSIDKPDSITNEKFLQQQKKSISIPPPRPSLALLSLPLPKPTSSSFARPNVQRGRPFKNSRIPNPQSTLPVRPRPEQQTSRPPPTVTPSFINNSTSEIRRQLLNGTGIFSAFHDSKYYRCNICKFKSVTSSTLLQHLFTHMFFCDQCSYYTYSYYNLSQHMFEKHHLNLIEEIKEPLNPKDFDLLYVTRCADGTFALCMDSSSSTTTNQIINADQQLIISSATPIEQYQNKSPKKKILKQKELVNSEDNDIILLSEKGEMNNQRSLIHSKQNQTYVLMKHRRCYSQKKSPCLHSLTLEYNICREHTIRHMCQTQDILKRRKYFHQFDRTRLIDEVANCLKTIVNQIVNNEENRLISPILSIDHSDILMKLLKLNNKSNQYMEQKKLYEDEDLLRQNHEHIFILSSPDINHTEQTIISSLHSTMTNGDSVFTQTKIKKTYDNAHQYLNGNRKKDFFDTQPTKVQKKINTTQSVPKQVPLRSVISKPSRPLPNSSVDKNNNSISSSKSSVPSVIILD